MHQSLLDEVVRLFHQLVNLLGVSVQIHPSDAGTGSPAFLHKGICSLLALLAFFDHVRVIVGALRSS